MDISNGKTESGLQFTLQPFGPSSPPRKKAKGGNKNQVSYKFLDLEEDDWGRFFVVKKKEGTFLNECSFKLNKFIKGIIGKTKSVKKLNDGSICIEAENRMQAAAILKLQKYMDAELEAGPHKRLNSSQGVITCRDFLNSTIEDIKEGLADQGVIEVRRIKRRQDGSLVDTASLVLTFDRPKPPQSINAAFYKLKVRPYIPSPMRCYKCQRFGHTSTRCKAPEAVCTCGKPMHDVEDTHTSGTQQPPKFKGT
ncbi:uncharacterized protein [Rhodnius prolixus]|uniref:uncharacterized protein n=1 Tax=Rhodnius prolixus TaxID=13249 RepID=UPI003D18FA24